MATTTTMVEETSGAFDYFIPLGVDATFRRVFHVFGKRWTTFTGIAFATYMVGWFFAILLSLFLGNDIRIDGFSVNYGTVVELEAADEIAFYLLEWCLYYVFACVAHGAAIWVTAHVYLHQSPHPYDSFDTALRQWSSLVCATLLIGLLFLPMLLPAISLAAIAQNGAIDPMVAMILIFFISVVFSIIMVIITYVVYPAIMVEKQGAWGSIKRSYNLAKGHWGYIVAILLIWGVVKFLIGVIIGSVMVRSMWVAHALDTIFGIFLLAIAPVFEGVIYFNLRVQKEELGSVKLGEEIGIDEGSYITMVPAQDPTSTEDPKEEPKDASALA